MKQIQRTVKNQKRDQDMDSVFLKDEVFRANRDIRLATKMAFLTRPQLDRKKRFSFKVLFNINFTSVVLTESDNLTLVIRHNKHRPKLDITKDRRLRQSTLGRSY